MWMKQQKPMLICMLIKYFECAYVIFGSKILWIRTYVILAQYLEHAYMSSFQKNMCGI